VQITAGARHSCALQDDGEIDCWGLNQAGQLGDGTVVNRTHPVPIAGGHRFAQISAGYSHTCGVTRSGVGLCWGESSRGELGNTIREVRRPRPL